VGSGGASIFDNNDVCVGFDEQQQIGSGCSGSSWAAAKYRIHF